MFLNNIESGKPEGKNNLRIDYLNSKNRFTGARYLKECCIKLEASVITSAIAANYYHRFFNFVEFDDYDCYLIACTSIYLASKVNDDDLKIRDIINVGYHTLHRKETSLSLEPYFDLRDSLVESELLLMRMLNFDLKVDLPHKHLLFYLNSLKHYLTEKVFEEVPLVRTTWSIVNDSYHLPLVTKNCPQLVAVCAINIALEIYGISLPIIDSQPWFRVFHESCTEGNLQRVTAELVFMYKLESNLPFLASSTDKDS